MILEKHGESSQKKDVLLAKELYSESKKPLKKFITFESQGKCQPSDIIEYLIGMAAERQSIHSLQRIVKKRPCETSIYHHLKKIRMEWLIDCNHLILMDSIKNIIPKKDVLLAVDLTDDPFYPKDKDKVNEYVVGGERKKSTNLFYRYATLYVMKRHRKFTLAVLPVPKTMGKREILEYFFELIKELEIDSNLLLLDRGFYSIKLIRYLRDEIDIRFIMPVKQTPKLKKAMQVRRSSLIDYTISNANDSIDVEIAVKVNYIMGRRKKHGTERHGFIFNGVDWKPHKIASVYRKRFGIEASYRMRNIVRPRTSTNDPKKRYLFTIVSLLLKNIWVKLKCLFFSKKQRGPRTPDEDNFRFDLFRILLFNHYLNRAGRIMAIDLPNS